MSFEIGSRFLQPSLSARWFREQGNMVQSKFCFLLKYSHWLSILLLLAGTASAQAATAEKKSDTPKRVIGPTVVVKEAESKFDYAARVDTGATTSSLHVLDWKVENAADVMSKNLGKTIRFCLKSCRGESEWLQRKIAEISVIKTSEQKEQRYKVWVDLHCHGVKKRVLVSLNDRSQMAYPLLLGRNFLQDDFVVDVALSENQTGRLVQVEKQDASKKK